MKKADKMCGKISSCKGNAILTTPIIIAIGVMLVSTLIVLAVNILMPYIWYEKLSSACIKYIFVMEEYGYLTKNEVKNLENELVAQGFDNNKLKISYTASRVSYGNPIFLKVAYDYDLKIPFVEDENIPMVIERNSVSKR
ncbi:MAG: hypothetical protein IJX99_08030 [Clostridia bacterium]|nr:hypothetical protein [Clostridia bacterium]